MKHISHRALSVLLSLLMLSAVSCIIASSSTFASTARVLNRASVKSTSGIRQNENCSEAKAAVAAAGTAAPVPETAALAGDGHVLADLRCHVYGLLYW